VNVHDEGLVDEDERAWSWPGRIALTVGGTALPVLFIGCLAWLGQPL
jgi:hypothetical protein